VKGPKEEIKLQKCKITKHFAKTQPPYWKGEKIRFKTVVLGYTLGLVGL